MEKRELLEAAARAFWGDEIDDVVSIEWSDADDAILYTHADNQDHDGHDRTLCWDPTEHDEQAFQLAVRLFMSPKFDREGEVYTAPGDGWEYPETYAEHDGDALAATRHSVTRAAAAIDAQRRESNENLD